MNSDVARVTALALNIKAASCAAPAKTDQPSLKQRNNKAHIEDYGPMAVWGGKWRALAAVAVIIAVGSTAACAPIVDYRGYLPKGDNIKQIRVGQTKGEIVALLGSPSTTATINTQNDSYYYISSVVERVGVFAPKVTDREILAVHFSPDGRVTRFGHYGLEDGQIVNFISRETPTRGREYGILQQLFQNIGRFGGS